MDKVVYINHLDLIGLNAITILGNSNVFLDYLDPIDFHFLLFSSLYQSGANRFQVMRDSLPETVRRNPFWSDKFVEIDVKVQREASSKAFRILDDNFNNELDKQYRAPQYINVHNFLSSLFYSNISGIPFVTAQFAEKKDFEFLESRISKELFHSINNFLSLVKIDTVPTITPQYSVLMKDVRRFEDIAEGTLYKGYSKAHLLLTEESNLAKAKKEVQASTLKLYNKYAKQLDVKSMTFSFIKLGKRVFDLFTNKPTALVGDFLIDSLEKVTDSKRMLCYYKVEEAHHMIMFANRVGEVMRFGGKDKLTAFFEEYKASNKAE